MICPRSRRRWQASSARNTLRSTSAPAPLAELARIGGGHTAVERAAISFVVDNDATKLDVPGSLAVRATTVRGSTKRPITIGDGLLAMLLGTPGIVGRSSRYRLNVSAAKIDIDVEGRSTTSGSFAYSHRADTESRLRARAALVGLLATVALGSAVVLSLPAVAGSLDHEHPITGAAGVTTLALFLVAWTLMMLAMMLPSRVVDGHRHRPVQFVMSAVPELRALRRVHPGRNFSTC